MIIKLKHKNANRGISFIKSGDMSQYCNITLTYQNKPEILRDIKKVLSKHYILKEQSQHKKKGSGSITRAFKRINQRREKKEELKVN